MRPLLRAAVDFIPGIEYFHTLRRLPGTGPIRLREYFANHRKGIRRPRLAQR